jgi:mRNA-degrading endonuclease toxin of MazEF toxin-antitoxin module
VRTIRRGEVWLADLEPTRGPEQTGDRVVLIVSADRFNQGRSGLVIAVPFHHRQAWPSDPRRGAQPFGEVPEALLDSIERRLRLLLGL